MLKIRKSALELIQNLLFLVVAIATVAFIRDLIALDSLGHAFGEVFIIALGALAIVCVRRERELSEVRKEVLDILDNTYLNGKTLRSVIESGFFVRYDGVGKGDFVHRSLLGLVMSIAMGPEYNPAIIDLGTSHDLIFSNHRRLRRIRLMTRSTSPDYIDWLSFYQLPQDSTADNRFCINNLWDFATPIAEFNSLCRQKMQSPETSYVLGEIISAYWLWSFADHTKHNFRDSDHDRKAIGLPATFRRDLEGPLHELGDELEKINHVELIPDLAQ